MLIVHSLNDIPIRLTEERCPLGKENSPMATVKILERPTTIDWDYDEDADVLYLSIGEPKPAIGIDIGNGLVLRYDESQHEVVGLTVIGLQTRLQKGLAALPGRVTQN